MKLSWEIDCLFWNIQRPSSNPDLVSNTSFKSHCSSSNTSSFGGLSKVLLPFISPSKVSEYKLLLNLSVFRSDGSQWPSMRWCEVEFFHLTLDSLFPINFQIIPFNTIKRNIVNNFFPKNLIRKFISISKFPDISNPWPNKNTPLKRSSILLNIFDFPII